jgi:uncharacterized protein (DUF4415 family)
MPHPIATAPKTTARGTVQLKAEVTGELRQDLVRIAQKRGEFLNETINKALRQYVAADKRRK